MVTVPDLAQFLRTHLPKTVGQWPEATVLNWLEYHARQGAVAVTLAAGELQGVGIGVRCDPSDMDDPWTRWSPTGTCFYLYQVAAITRPALAQLILVLMAREPEIGKLKIFAWRHGRRVRINFETIEKMAKGTQWET